MIQKAQAVLNTVWNTLRGALATYHAEQYGMGLVILISTYHVTSQMATVEGQWWVSGVMGIALGFFNATFAFRFFEATSTDQRKPALAGMAASVAVSIFIQYGFYGHAKNLDAWFWFPGGPNFHALLYGAWAPIFELLLGWSFGVRIRHARADHNWRSALTEQFENSLAELRAKLATALQDAQSVRDDLFAFKQRSVSEAEQARAEQQSLFSAERTRYTEQIAQLISERDEAERLATERLEQLNNLRTEQARVAGKLEGIESATPRRQRRRSATPQPSSAADTGEKIEKVHRFIVQNPGASTRAIRDEFGFSLGAISTYIDRLVQDKQLIRNEQGQAYPAPVQTNGMNGHH